MTMDRFDRIYRLNSSILRLLKIKGTGALTTMIGKIFLPKPEKPVIIKTSLGFRLKVDPKVDHGLEANLYYRGIYELGTLFVMDHMLRAGDNFIDVGANIGLMSVFAAFKVSESGRVFSFEADPDTVNILETNIQINELKNIDMFNIALGSKWGRGMIYPGEDHNRGASSLIQPEGSSTDGKAIEIKRLDELAEISGKRIRLMKIDVEGWELEVLKGSEGLLLGEDPPMIIVEYSSLHPSYSEDKKTDTFDYIKSIDNYNIYKLRYGKERLSRLVEIEERSQLPKHDNLFCIPKRDMDTIPKRLF